ncbi:MAG: CapA family protein [Bacteroidota bacterium]
MPAKANSLESLFVSDSVEKADRALIPDSLAMIDSVALQKTEGADSLDFDVDSRSELMKADKDSISISLIGVGDIMLGTNYPSSQYLPAGHDCMPLLSRVSSVLRNADLTIGNLEGCISDHAPLAKNCKKPENCYAFRMPNKFAACFKENGFDVLTLANNHVFDFGEEGVRHTKIALDKDSIIYAGLENHPVGFIQRKGLLIGICAFSPNRGTISINDIPRAEKIVHQLKDTADIVIVTFHGGAEGNKYQRVTREKEVFLGENRGNVYEFSHKVVDAGADIVIGHGPHVPRGIELYNDRLISYSLGNFCTYGRFNLRGANGLAPILKAELMADGRLKKAEIISYVQKSAGIVYADPDNKAAKLIRELSKLDFPESNLLIKETGEILIP